MSVYIGIYRYLSVFIGIYWYLSVFVLYWEDIYKHALPIDKVSVREKKLSCLMINSKRFCGVITASLTLSAVKVSCFGRFYNRLYVLC